MSRPHDTVEQRLARLRQKLPPPPQPVGAYAPFVRSGRLVFLAAQIPIRDGKPLATGKLGSEMTAKESGDIVRATVMNGLAALKAAVGDLNKVVRVVKLTGYVASAPGFTEQPAVLNHASKLLVAAFGERGRHARAAVGVAELPLGVPIELDMIFEVEP
jgi:enamine deaminase RidA (YjgF/YER057c/UK114 family)